jgi:phage head maturation protease
MQRRSLLSSAGFRRVMDGAFAEIGKVPRGGHEVAVVMEHDEVMMYCRGANQQVNG